MSAQVKAELKSGHIARHYNVEEENTVCKVTKQGDGFTSLITVIDAHPGRPLSIEKLPVRSALKQTDYPETMAEALKITAGEKEYVVILCIRRSIRRPTSWRRTAAWEDRRMEDARCERSWSIGGLIIKVS